MGLKGVAQKGKGKALAETPSSGSKRKLDSAGKAKSSGCRMKTDRGVLKFFDVVADDADGSDESEDDFMDDAAEPGPKVAAEPGKSFEIPFMPKEEVMDEDEFDKMMEDRYKSGSTCVTYAEDYEEKGFRDKDFVTPTEKDPNIWKVKCAVGREKYLAFCLMQKFVDLKSVGTKLHIISAFTVEHVKGFIFMEADKKSDLNLACNGIGGVYAAKVTEVPTDEVSRLFSIRREYNEVTVGMWARVKNGIYKGDLGEVMAVNKSRKRATVKLIPRIDLLALTEKFGEGRASIKRTSPPAPRLISASELEEFRPLIQSRQDRDTGKTFEVLDGVMIKDGFIFKKIAIDSLSFWGVVPREEEVLKFKTSVNHESVDMEWLSQLYGEEKKTNVTGTVVMPEKGESSSGLAAKKGFEVHDLVCFGRKDFGVIIGMEKDETYEILKEGAEGPVVVNVQRRDIKSGTSNMKFTASDNHNKTICISDTVKVTEGPYEGKQGVVKLIYRGTIFLYDALEEVNGGYFCCKSRICEKINPSLSSSKEKGEESEPVPFEDFPPSPKSPLSPEKLFQRRENRDFKLSDDGNIYSIGQLLRIRVGPLKGYLCRVVAIYRSDVTVKLDSKHKVITVKIEHLSEVQKKNPFLPSDDPSDLLGSDGGSIGWMDRGGASALNDGWNTGKSSGDRSTWGNSSANPSSPKGEADADAEGGWGSKVTPKKNDRSWGAQGAENNQAGDSAGKSTGPWDKFSEFSGDPNGSSGNDEKKWGNDENRDGVEQAEDVWGKGKNSTSDAGGSWGDALAAKTTDDPWGKGKSAAEGGGLEKKNEKPSSDTSWGNASQSDDAAGWGQKSAGNSGPDGFGGSQDSAWGKQVDKSESAGRNQGSAWGQKSSGGSQESAWGKKSSEENLASAWGQKSSCGNQESSWGKKSSDDNQGSTWGQKSCSENQESAWGKKSSDDNQDSVWGKKSSSENHASTWGQNTGSGNQESSWAKKSSCDNQDSALGKKNSNENQASAWGQKSRGGNQDSTWGKKSSDEGQSSAWGKKSSYENQDLGWGQKSNSGNQVSAWREKSSWSSESGGTNGNEDSAWGKKSNSNFSSGGNRGNEDSGWGNSNPNSESGGNGGNQSSWGGKSNWNSEAGGSDGSRSSWGGKSNWNSEPGGSGGNRGSGWGSKSSGSGTAEQNSNWVGKNDWSSGSGFKGSQSFDSGNEDQTDGGGGNWRGGRGGFRGRGGDRGGFGGRGGDRGGFGGRGDRGGFGRRGGDRGGFGGRGGDRGGLRGRGRSDRGDFGGRVGPDRGGGFGGTGRGRRDDNGGGGGWNNRDSGGNGGDGGGWSQGGSGFKKEWQGGGSSGNGETRNSGGGGCRQQSDGGNGGGWNSGQSSGGWKGSSSGDQGGGSWGKGTSSGGGTAAGGWGNNNNNSKSSGGGGGVGGGWGSTNNNFEPSGGGGWGTNNSNNSRSTTSGGGGGGGWGSTAKNSESSGGSGGWGTNNCNSSRSTTSGGGGGGGWGSTNNNSGTGSGGWGSTHNDPKSTNGSGGSGGWDKGGANGSGSGGGSWGTGKPGGGGSGWNADASDSKGKNTGGW